MFIRLIKKIFKGINQNSPNSIKTPLLAVDAIVIKNEVIIILYKE